MPSFPSRSANKRRKQFRKEFWPERVAWEGPEEIGYFCGPRTLPLIMQALAAKAVSGDRDASPVYLELLSRYIGQGVIEMVHDEDHSYAAGYATTRSWKDRMKILEDHGFIRTVNASNRRYTKVFLVHPALAMQGLRDAGKISDKLWQAYRTRAIEAKERGVDELLPENTS